MILKQVYIGVLLGLFFIGTIARIFLFRKAQRLDPIPLLRAGSRIEKYVGWLFATLIIFFLAAGGAFLVRPQWISWTGTFSSIDRWPINLVGFLLALASMVLMAQAQKTMGRSWRIGIDSQIDTELVTDGIFRYSRNPIFAGMILLAAGVFLVLPNVATLVAVVLTYVTINVEIRLEEDHLERSHGEAYRNYLEEVGRFAPRLRRRGARKRE